MATKRKFVTGLVAGVTAAALLLGGTFAWTSISQEAKNEAAGIVNVGGRLHDDFNGTNKDVYVENFTDPLNGGQPIYARIKLTEYMEVGSEAGKLDENGDYAADRKAASVVEGAKIDDVESWSIHKPVDNCAVCQENGTPCKFHEHWIWTMGGEGENGGSTVFMPTFNKDKDSLAADINGTYAGTNPTDKVYYDNYVTYITTGGAEVDVPKVTVNGEAVTIPDGATGANALTEANVDVTTVTNTAYYDDDTDTAENDHGTGTGVKTATETHTAKQTATAKVITMAEWLDPAGAYNSAPGNYWVYDEDGWAYWANPIMPGEATGLLLDGIKMEKNPGEKCYYAINVVAQFATVGDWEYFDGTEENGVFDGTDNAKTLLEKASQNVATVTVTNVSGATLLEPGQNYEFSASVSTASETVAFANTDFEWSVLNADGSANTKSNIVDGVLTVGANETSENLVVVAKALDEKYLGALGMCSVAVEFPPTSATINVTGEEDISLYTLGQKNVDIITATVGDDVAADGSFEWSVTDGEGNPLTETTLNVSEDKTTAELVISKNETANEIKVTAAYILPSGETEGAAVYRKLSANFEDTDDLLVEPYVMTTSDGSDNGLTMYFVRTAADMTDASAYAIAGRPLTAAYAGTGSWYVNGVGYGQLWATVSENFTSAIFINKMQPTSTQSWFWYMTSLKKHYWPEEIGHLRGYQYDGYVPGL